MKFQKAPNVPYSPIKERFICLCLNVIVAYFVFWGVNRQYIPTGGLESVWLISATSLWFFSLLSAPWFIPPRDAIIGAVGSILILVTMDLSKVELFSSKLISLQLYAVFFSVFVLVLAITALILHDKDQRTPVGRFAFKLTDTFGKGEILFSTPAVISIFAYYQQSFEELSYLVLYWILIVVGRPIERTAAAIRQLREDRASDGLHPTVGSVVRVDHPDIVRVKLSSAKAWKTGTLYTASLPDGSQRYVVALFQQTQGSEVIGTGLCLASADKQISLPMGMVCASHDNQKTETFLENLSGAKHAKLVGFVVENSSIGFLNFEVSERAELHEGDVVFARIDGQDIFYQIIGAETFEENFDQNPRGTHVVKAMQLGIYDASTGFTKFTWLPSMNTPLFSAGARQFDTPILADGEFPIGKVPSTNIEAVAKIDDLVKYHTAVLGVTGTGKTELALDVVREAVKQGTKVFCVDFTGDYRRRLADLNPTFPSPTREESQQLEDKLFDVETTAFGAPAEKKILQEHLNKLKGATAVQIDGFLKDEHTHLGIFELAEITNTKATLRLTELYLSTIMQWAKTNRQEKQQILIVLEEAHTIVPEVASSGFDSTTQYVVGRIGQIALQGRKYGVGLMVISQRTALVSKTILSQCNTFLTHSLIDQTSLSFLDNVYSHQHTKLIPNLGRFEFLAFGKGIKSERPILLKRDFDPKKLSDSLVGSTRSFSALEKEDQKPQVEGPRARPVGE